MKRNYLFALFFALTLFVSSSVSAYYFPSIRYASQDAVQIVTDFSQPLLTGLFGYNSYMYVFEILMIFLIVASLVYVALGKMPMFDGDELRAVRWILTIVVPLLGVRYIPYDSLIAILNSYQILAIAFSCILPFILYFMFLYSASEGHGVIRKLGWILFIAVYLGLWSSANVTEYNSMIYFWTFLAGLVCLFGDNIIARRYHYIEMKRNDALNQASEIGKINKQISDVQKMINENHIDLKDGQKMIKKLINDRDFIRKHL